VIAGSDCSATGIGADTIVKPIWEITHDGSIWDHSSSTCVDDEGNVYIVGRTNSTSGIAFKSQHLDSLQGDYDGFLIKYSPAGELLWATYVGGEDFDHISCIDTDGDGNIFIAGQSPSKNNISTAGAHQDTCYCNMYHRPGFIMKFNSLGVKLWGTYYGQLFTPIEDLIYSESDNSILITGTTRDTNFISFPQNSSPDIIDHKTRFGFVSKFDTDGQIIWGKYISTYGARDLPKGITLDEENKIVITGFTESTNLKSAINSPHGGGDGFVMKLDNSGTIEWSRFIGGSNYDLAQTVKIKSDSIFVCGETRSDNFSEISKGYQDYFGGGVKDGFLICLSSQGDPIYGTYIGGEGDDDASDFDLLSTDKSSIIITGKTTSFNNISTDGAYQSSYNGGWDSYLVSLDMNGNRNWGTYYHLDIKGWENKYVLSGVDCRDSTIYLGGDTNAGVNGFNTNLFLSRLSINSDIGVAILPSHIESVSIHPNPTADKVYINRGNTFEAIKYSLSSISGTPIESKYIFDNIIDLKNLGSGIYHLMIYNDDSHVLYNGLVVKIE
jgi:hypothetical protein